MATLSELISRIGDENVEVQRLFNCATVKKTNRAYEDLEITFVTELQNSNKDALVVWIDKDLLQAELDKIKTSKPTGE